MEFKYMSKKEIEDMIRTEIKTLGDFLKRVEDETDYDIQAFAKVAMFDDKEMDVSTGTLHFGDPGIIKSIVFSDDWITSEAKAEITGILGTIFSHLDREDDEDEI